MTMPDRIWLQQSATGPFKVLEPHDREFYRCTEYVLASTHTRAMEALREAREADNLLADVLRWAEARCPCHNETPNPCPLCGASVENLEPCKSAENTLPRDLLDRLRRRKATLSRIDAILKEDTAHD